MRAADMYRPTVGSLVEVRPAYDSDTGRSDRWDDYTAACGTVLRDDGADLKIEIQGTGDEVWISRRRLRWIGGMAE